MSDRRCCALFAAVARPPVCANTRSFAPLIRSGFLVSCSCGYCIFLDFAVDRVLGRSTSPAARLIARVRSGMNAASAGSPSQASSFSGACLAAASFDGGRFNDLRNGSSRIAAVALAVPLPTPRPSSHLTTPLRPSLQTAQEFWHMNMWLLFGFYLLL